MHGTTVADVAQLETRIQNRLRGHIQGVRLVVRENGLVLQGRSRTYYAKQLAQHTVMEVTNLQLIANEIVVS